MLIGDNLVEWKEIATGSFFAIVLVVMLGLILGTYGTFLGISIAGFITGLIGNNSIVDALVNGFFVGLLTGIFLSLLEIVLTLIYGVSAGFGAGLLGGTLGAGAEIYLIFLYVIITVVTAFMGSLIFKILNKG